jgi:hypothetical protein
MDTKELGAVLTSVWSELIEGAPGGGGAVVLNSGDAGLLRSLDRLTAADASRSANGGATIAAHAQHVRFGLSLMNRWAREGGDPFSDATWDAAWKIARVDDPAWEEIRNGLRDEASRWRESLSAPRQVSATELAGMVGSIAHLAYHLGAIRQIEVKTRGPREGTFANAS